MTATISPNAHLSFGGILGSEWIKLRTLRSTVWCYAVLVALTIGIGLLVAGFINIGPGADAHRNDAVQAATVGVTFGQLVVAVLGTLVITGEYGTGMIRSTIAAVPRRTPALIGKTVVFAIVTFVVSLVAMLITLVAATPIFASRDITYSLGDPQILLPIVGAALSLVLIGVLSLAIGAIVRNSAAGLATSLGLVLVLPLIVQLLAGLLNALWLFQKVLPILPSSLATQMHAYIEKGTKFGVVNDSLVFAPWAAGLVLFAWFAVFFIFAVVLLKRRDA